MSRQLVPRSGGGSAPSADPAFVQQGEVDWVSLSSAVVSVTVGTLARLSGAGVQEITYVGALQLATRFKLANIGKRRVCEAVERLRVSPAFDNVAYFGFGYRSFVRFLSDTEAGIKCIALCASLSEAHSEDLAARVISSLWTVVGYPEDYQPSLQQFRCLVKACAGVFAQSTFPITMGVMLGPHRNVRKILEPEASDPDAIAKALQDHCATESRLLGALNAASSPLCRRLFDLKTHVEDSHGNTVFMSSPSPEQTQVHIIYKEDEQLSAVTVSASTFVLEGPNDLLRYVPDRRLRLIRTRVPWDSCLKHTFGQDFTDLVSFPAALGDFLGGAARIFKALARGELEVNVFSRKLFIDYADASHGRGFVESMVNFFPELNDTSLLDSARSALSRSVSSTISHIEQAMFVFIRHCTCFRCDATENSDEAHRHSKRLCLLALAATVLDLIVTTGSVVCEREMLPTENGLYHIYERNQARLELMDGPQGGVEDLAKLFRLDEGFTGCGGRTPAGIMADTLCLFTGHEPSVSGLETYRSRTAVAESGICVYLDCLESVTTRPELLRRIHVIPGHIGRGTRVFNSVWDCAHSKAPFLERVKFSKVAEGLDTSSRYDFPEQLKLTALVDEPSGPGQLALYYQISAPQGQVFIQPGEISRHILSRSGLIVCSKSDCDERLPLDPYFVRAGWNFDSKSLKEFAESDQMTPGNVLVWKHRNSDIERLLAIEIQRQTSYRLRAHAHVLFARGECVPCSIRAASQIMDGWRTSKQGLCAAG
ncbi:hypothetical protein EDD37DRAFT_673560 [Exophiala viscosa]|uniref:Uncharacterized protein n=1 Tax=Exophiala viscosa TaxID=2486360 RepID=A0AAN6DM75_9EURO|nr:hypothetical protein EDD36DRAFT_422738 [Exophiala viscosa]KAI1620871.1 hypothetical protein EDD37DRAFT_673560 [Exophiala viscosa]